MDKSVKNDDDYVTIVQDEAHEKTKCRPTWRYITAVIGFLAMFNSYTLRSHLSVTMVAMVNSTRSQTSQTTSCSYIDNTTTSQSQDEPGPFNWNPKIQGILFGGFYWGYIIPQFMGGRMAEMYGPNKIVFVGGLLSTVATAIGPWAATVNVWFFFATRVACGFGLAVFTPCLHSLIAKWTPPNERSRLSAFIYSGNQIGVIFSMAITGLLCHYGSNGGWPWPFYFFAMISGLWSILWLFLVADSPAQNKWISKHEKDMIERKLHNVATNTKKSRLPYKHVFKSKPFWGLLFTHFGQGWGFYTLLTQLPTYMNNVLRFDIQKNGVLSAVPYVLLVLFGYLCSISADLLIKNKMLSVSNVRKTFQFIALVGSAVFLFVITFLNCQIMVIYSMLVLAVGVLGAMYAGYQINHVDLSPNFAGSLQGITNSFATIPGIVSPYVTGVIINVSDNQHGWSIIFYIACGILVAGATEYLIFGSGELQYWNFITNNDEVIDRNSKPDDEHPPSNLTKVDNTNTTTVI